jgi:hypothetical protein
MEEKKMAIFPECINLESVGKIGHCGKRHFGPNLKTVEWLPATLVDCFRKEPE